MTTWINGLNKHYIILLVLCTATFDTRKRDDGHPYCCLSYYYINILRLPNSLLTIYQFKLFIYYV